MGCIRVSDHVVCENERGKLPLSSKFFTEPQCLTEHTVGSADLSERFGNFTVLNRIFLYPSRLKF